MNKSEMRDMPPEPAVTGLLGKEDALFNQLIRHTGESMDRARESRDPDDMFGIWTHCERKTTTLRSLSRHRELESEVRA